MADVRVFDPSSGVAVVKRFALLTVAAHSVVLTLVAHSSAYFAGGLIYGRIKVASRRVIIAVADYGQ